MGKDNNVFDGKYVIQTDNISTEWTSTAGQVPFFLRSSGLLRERQTPYYSLSSPPSPSNPIVFPDLPTGQTDVCLSQIAAGVFLFNNNFDNSGTGSFSPTPTGSYEFVASGSGHYLSLTTSSALVFDGFVNFHDPGIEMEMRFKIPGFGLPVYLFTKRTAGFTSGSAQIVVDNTTGRMDIYMNQGAFWSFNTIQAIGDNDWHTIRFINSGINPTADTWSLYLDDKLVFYADESAIGDGRYIFPATTANDFSLGSVESNHGPIDIDYFIIRHNEDVI